jgi:hypothetical protein
MRAKVWMCLMIGVAAGCGAGDEPGEESAWSLDEDARRYSAQAVIGANPDDPHTPLSSSLLDPMRSRPHSTCTITAEQPNHTSTLYREYGALGTIVLETRAAKDGDNVSSRRIEYELDERGFILQSTSIFEDKNTFLYTEAFVYNRHEDGRLKILAYANDERSYARTYRYDALDRFIGFGSNGEDASPLLYGLCDYSEDGLERRCYQDEDGDQVGQRGELSSVARFDPEGKPLRTSYSMELYDGTPTRPADYVRSYDSAGHLVSERIFFDGMLGRNVAEFRYDAAGRLVHLVNYELSSFGPPPALCEMALEWGAEEVTLRGGLVRDGAPIGADVSFTAVFSGAGCEVQLAEPRQILGYSHALCINAEQNARR